MDMLPIANGSVAKIDLDRGTSELTIQAWWGADGKLHFLFPGTDQEWVAIPIENVNRSLP